MVFTLVGCNDLVNEYKIESSYVNNDKKLTVEGVKKLYTSLGATCE